MEEARAISATQTIERNALAMAQLIDDLLDVSGIVSGDMRLEVESVDVALVIERAIETPTRSRSRFDRRSTAGHSCTEIPTVCSR